MKTRLIPTLSKFEDRYSAAHAHSVTESRQSTAATMPDSRAVLQAQSQQQAYAIKSSHAAELMAHAKLMARAVNNVPSVQRELIQRVMIGKVDITAETQLVDIEEVLGWTKFYGVSTNLSDDQRRALIEELKGRDDCEEIRDALAPDDSESSSDSEIDIEELASENAASAISIGAPSISMDSDGSVIFSGDVNAKRGKKAAEDFAWHTFPESAKGWKKIGVHETRGESVEGLLSSGPSSEKFGTGHGLHKGRGFYVSHVGERTLYSATAGMEYGESFLAVYVPSDMPGIKSEIDDTNNVATLDETNGDSVCYYIMSGGSEIVVPERSLSRVKLVTKPEQLMPLDQ